MRFYLFLTCALILSIGCEQQPPVEKMNNPVLVHTVYFWLKGDVTDNDRKVFEGALRKLGTSTTTTSYHWGSPLQIEKRDVVDDSYDYALTSFFDSVEKHDIYQTSDPIHQGFIESNKHLWESVKVYDHQILE